MEKERDKTERGVQPGKARKQARHGSISITDGTQVIFKSK